MHQIYRKTYKYSEMEQKMVEARMKEQIYGDYYKILKHTKLDCYGMTIWNEIFGTKGHAKFFSTLDLQSQYYQFGIREEKSLLRHRWEWQGVALFMEVLTIWFKECTSKVSTCDG